MVDKKVTDIDEYRPMHPMSDEAIELQDAKDIGVTVDQMRLIKRMMILSIAECCAEMDIQEDDRSGQLIIYTGVAYTRNEPGKGPAFKIYNPDE